MATILENVYTLSAHLEDAYTALEGKGATIPQQKNAANLSATVDSVPAGGGTAIIDQMLMGEGAQPIDLVVGVTRIDEGNGYGGGGANLFNSRQIVKTVSFPNLEQVSRAGCQNMFQNCTSLLSVLSLPATTLAPNCYNNMFNSCTSLKLAPELPATTLAENCYNNMFNSCTSLSSAPELPAGTLAPNCYTNMFQNCTSLTTAPALSATTLASYCYQYMFSGCSLSATPELPATTLAANCYARMFQNCLSLKTASALPATTLVSYCYQYMFSGCSLLSAIPEMPAVTLANNCCQYMFQNCTSLTGQVTVQTGQISSVPSNALYCMFKGCTNLTKVVLDFTACVSVPSLASIDTVNVFDSRNDTRLEIRVPASLASSWKTASNWSTYSARIVGV